MEKAQKGDLIRMLITEDGWFKKGDILEVVDVDEYEDGATASNGVNLDIPVNNKEYVIHRKAGEEDSDIMTPEQQAPPIDAPEYPEGTTFSPNGLFPIEPTDAVNPQHYKQGRVEVIDIIEDAVEGADPFEAVCQANVLKYALRYRHKNGVEDLRKSIWYMEKLIAYLDAKSTQD